MMELKTSSTPNLVKNKLFISIFFILAFLGFLDASYLTINHYRKIIPPCSIAHGCETVLTSKFATIAGIPIATAGIVYYITMLVLVILYLQSKYSQKYLRLLLFVVISGLIVSGVLFYIQAFILHAFCQYCLASEVIIIFMFIVSIYQLLTTKNKKSDHSQIRNI